MDNQLKRNKTPQEIDFDMNREECSFQPKILNATPRISNKKRVVHKKTKYVEKPAQELSVVNIETELQTTEKKQQMASIEVGSERSP